MKPKRRKVEVKTMWFVERTVGALVGTFGERKVVEAVVEHLFAFVARNPKTTRGTMASINGGLLRQTLERMVPDVDTR